MYLLEKSKQFPYPKIQNLYNSAASATK